MRKTALAFALAFAFALLMLAQPISAVTSSIMAQNSSDDSSDSVVNHSGNDQGRKCQNCGYPMKLCLPPSEYKWICHNCGCCVMR